MFLFLFSKATAIGSNSTWTFFILEMTFFFARGRGFQILVFLGLGGIPSQVLQVFLDGRNTTFLFGARPIFRGETVSFTECI